MQVTDLKNYNNSWYSPGAGPVKRFFWYLTNATWFNSAFPLNGWKVFLLRLFGARIGKGVVLKPHVNIKYPWKLSIGDHSWIGEYAWIDNLGEVRIGNNVCISQGALLLCGNHDYKKKGFDLIVGDIVLEDGVWIGAKSVVCPKVTCHSHSVLSAGSILTGDMDPYSVYQGNPAVKTRERVIQ